MSTVFEFTDVFDATLYPELADPELAAKVQRVVEVEKRGIHAKCFKTTVSHNGVTYQVVYHCVDH